MVLVKKEICRVITRCIIGSVIAGIALVTSFYKIFAHDIVGAKYAQQLNINILKTLDADIDVSRVNRITARGESASSLSISEVIGDGAEFSYDIDSLGNLYIRPNIEVGSNFEITINLSNDKTQTLKLHVKDTGTGRNILLSDNEYKFKSRDLESKILEIISGVKEGSFDLLHRPGLKKKFKVMPRILVLHRLIGVFEN